MPKFRITAPDGKTFDVEGPEGSTQEQALAKVQESYNITQLPGDVGRDAIGRLNEKPFGSGLTDLAYKAGGNVTDLASRMGLPANVAAGLGFGANVLSEAAPTLLSGNLVGKAAAPLLESAGERLMQSALKPTLESLRTGKAARAITTMLEEGYNATKGGVEAMKAKIGELGDEVSQAISNSPATVDKAAVADRLRGLLDRVQKQVNPQADINSVTKAWTDFLNHPALLGRTNMTVQEAQAMKQGTYKALGDKAYGELKGAETEAQKTLARGLREEIASAVPDVVNPLSLEAALINAKNVANRRVMMHGNNNPLGLAGLSGSPTSLLAMLADKSALAKSLAARGLYQGSSAIPNAAMSGTLAGVLANAQDQPEDLAGILARFRQ